jgi:hypothetical protein
MGNMTKTLTDAEKREILGLTNPVMQGCEERIKLFDREGGEGS